MARTGRAYGRRNEDMMDCCAGRLCNSEPPLALGDLGCTFRQCLVESQGSCREILQIKINRRGLRIIGLLFLYSHANMQRLPTLPMN